MLYNAYMSPLSCGGSHPLLEEHLAKSTVVKWCGKLLKSFIYLLGFCNFYTCLQNGERVLQAY